MAADTITSGLEGAWTSTPTAWSILYLNNLFRFEWKQVKSPTGAAQWVPTDEAAKALVADAHDTNKRHVPIVYLALKEDPGFRQISQRYAKNPKECDLAFAKAWFRRTHRDLGPRASADGKAQLVDDFVAAWTKLVMLDRFSDKGSQSRQSLAELVDLFPEFFRFHIDIHNQLP